MLGATGVQVTLLHSQSGLWGLCHQSDSDPEALRSQQTPMRNRVSPKAPKPTPEVHVERALWEAPAPIPAQL